MKGKHIFAGNNTSKGFFNCFNSIFQPSKLNQFYILKGGPGVGKSSFMKKFAAEISKKGYFVEYIHCSSDDESLDGIIIPDLKLAFVDGTAPHATDPSIPGAVDEILNFGSFLNSSQLEKHKHKIIQINQTKARLYKSAYRYLQAAGIISEEINSLYTQFIDADKFNETCLRATKKLFEDDIYLQKTAEVKNLFSEAYTSNGYINRTEALYEGKKVWAIISESTAYISDFMKRISDEAVKRGFDVEIYLHPLTPDKLQHVYIPEKNIFITSSENCVSDNFEEIFDIHQIMDADNLKKHISEIESNLHMHELLIKNALKKLSEGKKYHEILEIFYINSMNFKGVDELFNNILREYT
ncbi:MULTISPECIES: hypothetical protein [unclassified Sedimentibacter]|uniref:hypothetical protein n=1 Tax=unclassified Sedimentibacter TaxID=2649220 RepID=UPI0027DF2318|nr:hypothetical protein [Sedimentibacter sp. MB35-C1]WMJ77760.1 hypothetical protein RBQ61_02185 [Sedimentibacter sp. MB35-C1]